MCGGDAALCQITLTTCYYYFVSDIAIFVLKKDVKLQVTVIIIIKLLLLLLKMTNLMCRKQRLQGHVTVETNSALNKYGGLFHKQFHQDGPVPVLFLSLPRSKGWPHHGCSFSIYLYPLLFCLTLPQRVLSTT